MPSRHSPAALLILAALAASPAALAETLPEPPAPATVPAHPAAVVHKTSYKVRRTAIPASGDVFGGAAVLPTAAADRFAAAPMPDDEIAPAPRTLSEVNTEPKLFTMKTQFRGDGYPYGATPQGLDDKYSVQVPGVDVTVPLLQ